MQVYNELIKEHEVLLPENFDGPSKMDRLVNLDALEKIVKDNNDIDLIFDFRGTLLELMKWYQKGIKIPIIYFAVNAIDRPYVAKMSLFSYVWYVEKYAMKLMEQYQRDNLIYLGLAANPYQLYPIKIEKIIDVGFIGQHYGERAFWLNKIHKFCIRNKLKFNSPKSDGSKIFLTQEKINELYNQTKINISFAPKEPPGRIVNMRTFEICMSGNFQLMQYTPCVEEFFDIDKEIVCWKNRNDLFDKIQYYLENKEEREKIAKNGYEKAIKEHTWSNRIKTIKYIIEKSKVLDISRYVVELKQSSMDSNERNPFKSDLNFIKAVLNLKGYNIRKNVKTREKLRVSQRDSAFYYKPKLNNFLFIKINRKVMMVIQVLKKNDELNNIKWESFNQIVHLTENIDLTFPQFGLITNGKEYLIRDFYKKTWLQDIPTRKALKSRMNIRSFLFIRTLTRIKSINQKYNLTKNMPFFKFKKNIKAFLDFFEDFLRKFLKSPQALKFR